MRYARVLSAMLLLLGAAGCPWTEPAPRLPLVDPPVMDLVVGDMGLQTGKSEASWELEQPKVLVYFDVLNAALEDSSVQPAADLVLGIPEPAEEKAISVGNPVDVELNEGDLYLVDQSARRVYIWRDYRSHSDYDEPDVTLLANVSSSQGPWELFVAEGCLFVTDFYRGLLIWQNAATIETDDLPDIAIAPDAARNMLSGVELDENGHLFVSWLSGGMEVYYDFMDEYLADAAIEADVTLSGPSFSNMTAPIWKVLVENNVLYAHTHSSSSTLFVFSPADDLSDEQLPDAVITPAIGRLTHPFSMAVAGDTLFVGNMFSDYVGVCGFRPADALETGQAPTLMLDYFNSAMGPCSNLCVRENILFATSSARPVCGKQYFMEDMNLGDIHIFGHADMICDADQANIIIKGGIDFLVPLSIDAALAPEG